MTDQSRYDYIVVKYEGKQSEHIEAAMDQVVGNRRLHSITPLSGDRLLITIENVNGKGRYANLEKDMESVVGSLDGGNDA